jgi:RNA polymerase sigma-19 factor, ECF subfamily
VTVTPVQRRAPGSHERVLIERMWAGDRRAFETIFRAYFGDLATYAARLVGSLDAEDVVQDVFVGIWTDGRRLTPPDYLSAYLHRAVRNRAVNRLRHRRMVLGWQTREAALGEPQATRPDRELENAELGRAIKEAAAGLSPRCREVFRLSREGQLTYTEIAEVLGISVKTVESLMGRALKALRLRLAIHRPEPGERRPRVRGAVGSVRTDSCCSRQPPLGSCPPCWGGCDR